MSDISAILAKAKLSDGKRHLPLSPQDRQMRLMHTQDSIEHQLKHISDHGAELVVQLGKLAGLDSGKADELIKRAEKLFYGLCDDVKEYKVEM